MRHVEPKASSLSSFVARGAVAASLAALALFAPSTAHAEEVSPTGKGIVGGALLGAEVVTIPMALFNVQSGAAYAIGGGVGAVGGGVGGYFVEKGVSDGRIPVYMLAGGLALVIPTVVLVLNATAYKPVEGAREDRAPSGPPADPGAVGGSVVIGAPPAGGSPAPATPPATPPASQPAPPTQTTPAPATPPPAGPPQSLIDFHGPALRVGVPMPEVRPMYSLAEQKRLGVAAGTQVEMKLVHVTF